MGVVCGHGVMMDRRPVLAAFALAALFAAAILGCGSSDRTAADRTITSSGPDAYWQGAPGDFCRQRVDVPVESDGGMGSLLLERHVASPGTRLLVRVENRGGLDLSYGTLPLVQQRIDGRWVGRGFEGGKGAVSFSLVAYRLLSGGVGSCMVIPAARTWPPGHYRVRFRARALMHGGGAERLVLVSYFDVSEREQSPASR